MAFETTKGWPDHPNHRHFSWSATSQPNGSDSLVPVSFGQSNSLNDDDPIAGLNRSVFGDHYISENPMCTGMNFQPNGSTRNVEPFISSTPCVERELEQSFVTEHADGSLLPSCFIADYCETVSPIPNALVHCGSTQNPPDIFTIAQPTPILQHPPTTCQRPAAQVKPVANSNILDSIHQYTSQGPVTQSALCQASEKPVNLRSRLEIAFLPAEERIVDGGTKYSRVAEVVRLKDGTLKLFAERGRQIETRITLDDNGGGVHPSNVDHLRLRFTPYSSCGGVCKPVIGYHNQVQKAQFAPTAHLCFVQLVEDQHQCANHRYVTDSNGYMSLETPLIGRCGIYPLVFPYHNSQCPTTCRKTVYIRVSLVQPDGSVLDDTEFELVSCASPYRDSNRFRARQLASNTTNNTGCDLATSAHETKESVCITDGKWTVNTDLDISPGSSGFASLGSPPVPFGMCDEVVCTHSGQVTCSNSAECVPLPVDKTNAPGTHRMNSTGNVSQQIAENYSAAVREVHATCTAHGMKRSLDVDFNNLVTCYDESNAYHSNAVGQNCQAEEREFVIKTKNWRIYRILQMLETELSEAWEQSHTSSKRFRTDVARTTHSHCPFISKNEFTLG